MAYVSNLSDFSQVADQAAQAVQRTLDESGQQLTAQLELRSPEGKKAWRTICTYSGPVAPEPTRPVMQQLWDLAGLLEEPQRSNIRERLEMEAAARRAGGEIEAHGVCPYCSQPVRLLVRFNTNAEPIYLQCTRCLAPMRLPEPIL